MIIRLVVLLHILKQKLSYSTIFKWLNIVNCFNDYNIYFDSLLVWSFICMSFNYPLFKTVPMRMPCFISSDGFLIWGCFWFMQFLDLVVLLFLIHEVKLTSYMVTAMFVKLRNNSTAFWCLLPSNALSSLILLQSWSVPRQYYLQLKIIILKKYCTLTGIVREILVCFYLRRMAIFGEGNGNSLQCSCLENPVDGGAWWAAVHRVT